MSLATPQFLRNVLKARSLLTRPVATSCPRSTRPLTTPSWKQSEAPRKIQWSCQRQWSSSAYRTAPAPRRSNDEEKDDAPAASEPKKPDETFYMPPPPEYLRRHAAPAPPTSPREDIPDVKSTPTPPPEPQNPKSTPAAEAPETETSRQAQVEEEAARQAQEEKPTEQAVKEETPATAEEALPSQRQEQRWQISKRWQERMDELLAKAALVSHQVNNYTGTDYSGIERLRRDIIDQEQVVKSAHASVAAAKEAYTTSYSQQAASQKEVVGLLERKHSWSAADLERYMSLIRSEHLNEQAVQKAKEELADAERNLEDARTRLEKKERKQYHEEQIWSDTIRRNSTWVTFGLMGLNILLLLANLVIIEPWRRRRMVREIRTALDEATITSSEASDVEAEVDQVVEPTGETLERMEEQAVETLEAAASEITTEALPELEPEMTADSEEVVGQTALAAGEMLPEEAVELDETTPEITEPIEEAAEQAAEAVEEAIPQPRPENWKERLALWKNIISAKLALYKAKLQDLFSERQVTLKKVDVTAVALEGAAAGVVMMGMLWALLSPP